MTRSITVGIDVGTHITRVLVAELRKGEPAPRIIGMGASDTAGMRFGYIVSVKDAASSIGRAVREAEKSAGVKIDRACFSIGGISLAGAVGCGASIISKTENRVTAADVAKAATEAEKQVLEDNAKILHAIPVSFKLDGKKIYGRPEGLHGAKLEAKMLFTSASVQHVDALIAAAEEAGIEVSDIVASPIAASKVAVNDKQKISGSVLIDIGAETVTTAVFEDGALAALWSLPLGSGDITNDIALGFRIAREEAEGLKIGSIIGDYPKKKLSEIVEARLSDIFELTDKQLKKIGRSGLLPGGAILIGGGSKVPDIVAMAKNDLKLPAKLGDIEPPYNKNKLRDSSWFTAYGVCVLAAEGDIGHEHQPSKDIFGSLKEFFSSVGKQLLP